MVKIADIIKYEGDNTTFIWKHPCEDFNALTQLIVHESQEAIFMMNCPGAGSVRPRSLHAGDTKHPPDRQSAEHTHRWANAVPLRGLFYQQN